MSSHQKEKINPYAHYVGFIGILQDKAIPTLLTRVSIHVKTGVGLIVHGYLAGEEKPLQKGEAIRIVGTRGTESVVFRPLDIS